MCTFSVLCWDWMKTEEMRWPFPDLSTIKNQKMNIIEWWIRGLFYYMNFNKTTKHLNYQKNLYNIKMEGAFIQGTCRNNSKEDSSSSRYLLLDYTGEKKLSKNLKRLLIPWQCFCCRHSDDDEWVLLFQLKMEKSI